MASATGPEVAPGVLRLGSRFINWYLVEDGTRITVVDAGIPGYWDQLPLALELRGRRLEDVDAVALTHGHVDHVGLAARIAQASGARVLVHEADEELVKTGAQPPRERSLGRYLWRPAALGLFLHVAHAGSARFDRPKQVETFSDGEELDVPGRPRAIRTPGHSDGSCCLHFPDRDVLIAGDTLCTRNVLTGRRGPQISPGAFNRSSAEALESLSRIEEIEASLVLTGHGEPWRDGVASAVERARAAGPS